MIEIRPAASRGGTNIGWLDSRHSFSFGKYYDPRNMGFRALRVINDDRVAPGGGFPTHGHANMEIISYVLEGALSHKDSLGTGSVIRPGDVQRMSAGTGVRHSEFNGSDSAPVHFLQIWIEPARGGLPPSYEQKNYSTEQRSGKLRLIGAHDGRDGAVTVHQDVEIYASILNDGDRVTFAPKPGRSVYLHVASGTVTLNGQTLEAGDGAAITDEKALELGSPGQGEVLLFDLA